MMSGRSWCLIAVAVACLPGACGKHTPGGSEAAGYERSTKATASEATTSRGRPETAALLAGEPGTADLLEVHPGESIQEALDRAAESPDVRRVVVHAGTYRPSGPRQALVWFNARHEGLTLEARGEVVLTAANPDLADRTARSFPAICNHVVYFGDGIGPATVLRGFRITGANNFVTRSEDPLIQPEADLPELQKTTFFYTDGGGIKVFGRSYPTIENVEIVDNYSSPCGAGISIEHRGHTDRAVTIRNCVFRNNRVPLTGAAIDLLDHELGSSAVIENCLFVNNLSNEPLDALSRRLGTWKPREGHGALTVFPHSKAVVRRSTFVGNRNGVDDLGDESVYEACIFWKNEAAGSWATAERYEADVKHAAGVQGCYFGGPVREAEGLIDGSQNKLDAPDPRFDADYVPQNPAYRNAGYRPVGTREPAAAEASSGEATHTGQAIAPQWTDEEPLTILVRGSGFRWHIHYPGADGCLLTADDVKTERHLHLPAGATIDVRVESDDYLYTIYLPAFHAREMAVPDLPRHLHFKTSHPGASELKGDQLCGFAHSELVGSVVVHDPNEFLRWCADLRREAD